MKEPHMLIKNKKKNITPRCDGGPAQIIRRSSSRMITSHRGRAGSLLGEHGYMRQRLHEKMGFIPLG